MPDARTNKPASDRRKQQNRIAQKGYRSFKVLFLIEAVWLTDGQEKGKKGGCKPWKDCSKLRIYV